LHLVRLSQLKLAVIEHFRIGITVSELSGSEGQGGPAFFDRIFLNEFQWYDYESYSGRSFEVTVIKVTVIGGQGHLKVKVIQGQVHSRSSSYQAQDHIKVISRSRSLKVKVILRARSSSSRSC
jgi:hypothetical protein